MNSTARCIVITGFMGAGKTTAARALAARLGESALDLDQFIADREGRGPQIIINEEGEARFREIETAALRDALAGGAQRAVALGGGAWTIAENRALITAHDCLTVWLDAPFELCWRRIEAAGDARPLARDREQARDIYRRRRGLYELAALRLEINEGMDADEIASIIIRAIQATNDVEEAQSERG